MPSLPPSKFFPPAEAADANGLVGYGGVLSPEWLLDAYRHGIFPWPMGGEESPLGWWSLNPRAIFEIGSLYVSQFTGGNTDGVDRSMPTNRCVTPRDGPRTGHRMESEGRLYTESVSSLDGAVRPTTDRRRL